MDGFDFVIRMGSEKEKEEILTKYPGTKSVIRDGGILLSALKDDEIIGFYGCSKERYLPLSLKTNGL